MQYAIVRIWNNQTDNLYGILPFSFQTVDTSGNPKSEKL